MSSLSRAQLLVQKALANSNALDITHAASNQTIILAETGVDVVESPNADAIYSFVIPSGEIPSFHIAENVIIEEISTTSDNQEESQENISNNGDQDDPDFNPTGALQNSSCDEEEGIEEPESNYTEDPAAQNGSTDNDLDETENKPPKKRRKFLATREQRSKNKYLRMRGQAYKGLVKDHNGKYKLEREVGCRQIGQPCTSQKCEKSKVFKCQLFSETERKEMFKQFWEDLSWDMKRTYISGLVDSVAAKRKMENSRRNETLHYSLKKGTGRLRVCKNMFLSTLGVKEWTVREYSRKTFGLHIADENKSMENRARNSAKERKRFLDRYIDELPKMPSHYCRSSTGSMYLEPIFQSKLALHREYKRYCESNNQQPLSEKILMETLKRKNIKLYLPRKDLCDVCIGHKLGNVQDEIYLLHQRRKELARSSKEKDKTLCKESDGRIAVVTVDTQAVKLAPMLQASAIYYKTKLCVHNYTVYNLHNGDVVCYLWDESQGGLEANNFATMVIDYLASYLQKVPDTQKFIVYSDGCGYQNKNCLLSNALLKFSIENKIPVYQKYFEKGHSQMEADSAHSCIERKLKKKDIYLPTDYIAVCREARTKNPFTVKYLNYEDFKNYSKINYYSSIRPGYKAGDPKVNEIHCLAYLPSGEIKYKLHYEDEWKDLYKRPKMGDYQIFPLYKSRPKIKTDKYNHLQMLKSVLDKQFWQYYDSLPN